jgi:hypothetical protein
VYVPEYSEKNLQQRSRYCYTGSSFNLTGQNSGISDPICTPVRTSPSNTDRCSPPSRHVHSHWRSSGRHVPRPLRRALLDAIVHGVLCVCEMRLTDRWYGVHARVLGRFLEDEINRTLGERTAPGRPTDWNKVDARASPRLAHKAGWCALSASRGPKSIRSDYWRFPSADLETHLHPPWQDAVEHPCVRGNDGSHTRERLGDPVVGEAVRSYIQSIAVPTSIFHAQCRYLQRTPVCRAKRAPTMR